MDKELIDTINNIYWQYTVGPQMVKKPQDLAVLTSMCAFGYKSNRGPIGIAKCLFNGEEEVTLVTLGGTQFKEGQATRFRESKLTMKCKDNDYLTAILDAFSKHVPKDKPVIISGISLGGMIAQFLLSKEEIVNNYNIKSVICFGSPLNKPLDRKGIRIKRFTDKGDIVPKLKTLSYLFIKGSVKDELNKNERILENGNYKKTIESHALSYVQSKVWDKYDFYGELNGNNTLELLEEMKFYEAPVLK